MMETASNPGMTLTLRRRTSISGTLSTEASFVGRKGLVSVGHDPEAEPFEKRDDLPGSETGQDRGDEAGVRPKMKRPGSRRSLPRLHRPPPVIKIFFPGRGIRSIATERPSREAAIAAVKPDAPADNGDIIKGRAHAASICIRLASPSRVAGLSRPQLDQGDRFQEEDVEGGT